MGALFFVGFMVILCILAGVFFLMGSIFLILSIVKKYKGKKTKGLVIATILSYCIFVVIIALPIGWFAFLRIANQQTFDEYEKTGVYVSSTASEIYRGGSFYYDGDLYIGVDDNLNGFQIVKEKAVANAKSTSALMDKIFNYNNEATIYSVKNECGYPILSCGNSLYYREADKDKIIRYYSSLAEYKYSYIMFGSENGIEYIDMLFEKSVFEYLNEKYGSSETTVTIADDTATEYCIQQTSADGIYYRSIFVLLTKNSAYVTSTSSGGTHTGYPLDDETADYLKNALEYEAN